MVGGSDLYFGLRHDGDRLLVSFPGRFIGRRRNHWTRWGRRLGPLFHDSKCSTARCIMARHGTVDTIVLPLLLLLLLHTPLMQKYSYGINHSVARCCAVTCSALQVRFVFTPTTVGRSVGNSAMHCMTWHGVAKQTN